jgi:hypothetical protein
MAVTLPHKPERNNKEKQFSYIVTSVKLVTIKTEKY